MRAFKPSTISPATVLPSGCGCGSWVYRTPQPRLSKPDSLASLPARVKISGPGSRRITEAFGRKSPAGDLKPMYIEQLVQEDLERRMTLPGDRA